MFPAVFARRSFSASRGRCDSRVCEGPLQPASYSLAPRRFPKLRLAGGNKEPSRGLWQPSISTDASANTTNTDATASARQERTTPGHRRLAACLPAPTRGRAEHCLWIAYTCAHVQRVGHVCKRPMICANRMYTLRRGLTHTLRTIWILTRSSRAASGHALNHLEEVIDAFLASVHTISG